MRSPGTSCLSLRPRVRCTSHSTIYSNYTKTSVEGTRTLHVAARNVPRAIQRATRISALVPFTRAVFLSGSYASGGARADSDVDLIFIVAPGRVWTHRFFLEVISRVTCARRTKTKKAGRMCFALSMSGAYATLPNRD